MCSKFGCYLLSVKKKKEFNFFEQLLHFRETSRMSNSLDPDQGLNSL